MKLIYKTNNNRLRNHLHPPILHTSIDIIQPGLRREEDMERSREGIEIEFYTKTKQIHQGK